MIGFTHYLMLAALMFTIGVIGVLIRRNLIVIFMSIELMLNSVNLALVSVSKYIQNVDGQIFVFFVITVAAAEAAVGLAIIISLFRLKQSMHIDEMNELKG
ncbi:MAG: NADH-quinone oxidoreductase subunit K [Deltaproteobacteria bacterium RIFCSPHIGHO2_02_FULL_40_11]|nr:MAG: NADH-quinone oxidoreductase subunit K [Deltaproteobacteria bacterium RIFCSPHIGHO2_02_FULL_40_11]